MTISTKDLPDNPSELKKYIHSLQNNFQQAEADIAKQRSEFTALKLQYDYLLEQFKLSKQRQFGRSCEKNLLQETLFDEAGAPLPDEVEAELSEETETITYERKKRGCPKRAKLPAHFPREVRMHDIPESEKICDACGGTKTCFGKDLSEQLKVIPPQFIVIQHQRLKWCCNTCEGEISIAPKPRLFFPKSMADTSLIAYTIIMKYADHVPLYRQEAIWQRYGIPLPRNTLCGWVMKAAELCKPLYEEMKKECQRSRYVQADETPVQVLKEPQRKNHQKSYMWVYRKAVGDPVLIYEYQETRRGQHAKNFLGELKGYVQTDAYSGYDWMHATEDIQHLGCMAHARRPFAELVKLSKKKKGLSHQMLGMIKELYDIERLIKGKAVNERYDVRQEKAKPLLDKIRQWLVEHVNNAPPKGVERQA